MAKKRGSGVPHMPNKRGSAPMGGRNVLPTNPRAQKVRGK